MRKIIFLFLTLSLLLSVAACSPANTPEKQTSGSSEACEESKQESESGSESQAEQEKTGSVFENKSPKEILETLMGNWQEENADLHLTIQKTKLILCSGDMCRPIPYQLVAENDKLLLIQSEEQRDFGLISEICIQADGSLTADEQGAAGEAKHYRFVREDGSEETEQP